MQEQNNYLMLRIEALETENKRLNDELRKVKQTAFEVKLSDPNFDRPINEIKVNL